MRLRKLFKQNFVYLDNKTCIYNKLWGCLQITSSLGGEKIPKKRQMMTGGGGVGRSDEVIKE